jgi:hypothetical protein
MIGYAEKYGFVVNLAKTLRTSGKNVLVVDGTIDNKYKYVIPTLNVEDKFYVTQYDGIDFAVGFDSMHNVENYMVDQKVNISLYDYILIDMDDSKTYEFFRTRGIDKFYFFIDTTVLSLAKNKEIIKTMKVYSNPEELAKIKKIYYRGYLTRTGEHYFEDKLAEMDIKWDEIQYEIPDTEQDRMIDIDSQISGVIDIRKHTREFIMIIADMTAEILGDISSKEVINQIKRGRA